MPSSAVLGSHHFFLSVVGFSNGQRDEHAKLCYLESCRDFVTAKDKGLWHVLSSLQSRRVSCREDAEVVRIVDRIREGSGLAASVVVIIYDIDNDDGLLSSSVIALSFHCVRFSIICLLYVWLSPPLSYAFPSSRLVMHFFVDFPHYSSPNPCTQD